jgi:quercetin dioxygenase-like cupin family protein
MAALSSRGTNPEEHAMAPARKVAPKTAPKTAKPRHRFSFVRCDAKRFKGGGLRASFSYRDLGIRRATAGMAGAHVIRAEHLPQATQNRMKRGGTGRHRHTLAFQMVYVLKGRVSFWYEGRGKIAMRPGDCVYQPPGIRHELLDWSRDMELLEITMPAEFATQPG